MLVLGTSPDTASEVKRALQILSAALVVSEGEESHSVRPHQLAQSAGTATAAAVSEKRQHRVEQLKELRLSDGDCDSVKEVGFKHLLLSHYRNQLLHWFIPEAMLALSLSDSGDNDTSIGEVFLLHFLST